jgi:hypothetical protein
MRRILVVVMVFKSWERSELEIVRVGSHACIIKDVVVSCIAVLWFRQESNNK